MKKHKHQLSEQEKRDRFGRWLERKLTRAFGIPCEVQFSNLGPDGPAVRVELVNRQQQQ